MHRLTARRSRKSIQSGCIRRERGKMDRPETTNQDERSLDVLVVDDDQEAVEELVEYL